MKEFDKVLDREIRKLNGDRKEVARKMLDFKMAYNQLVEAWSRSPEVLDNAESIKDYPFKCSFDDYNVNNWVEATIGEFSEKS